MDYIITDEITSPLSLSYQYSEKLAHMPHTFFIGDHANMFRHMTEKVVIVGSQQDDTSKITTTVDNRSIVNATNLKPILERSDVKVLTVKYLPNRPVIQTSLKCIGSIRLIKHCKFIQFSSFGLRGKRHWLV